MALWPQEIENRHIFTPDFNKSIINSIVYSSASEIEDYSLLQFSYWPIDTTIFATYPTKNSDNAFADLQSGRGIVVIEPSKPQISITSIYLGYYISQNYIPYLLPIYIFEGPQFVAYVSAVDDIFVSE